jgi:voltage-dependent potassium channel beta subunit
MNYRQLGKSGLQISELSFGSWVTFHNQVDVDATVQLMATGYDAGMNFFDNAEVYAGGKSEEVMGAALKRLGWRRGSYLVSTKLYWGLHENPNEQSTLNRKYLIEGIDGSLKRFDLDYVDLLYCHRADPTTPIEETVRAMHTIIETGRALIVEAIGIAERHHLHKPVVEQPVYNLLQQHRFGPEYDAVYKEHGYGSTTWSPLASGMLTGKYQDGIPKDSRGSLEGYDWLREELTNADRLATVAALEPLAKDMGASLAQFSLAWCLQNPLVSSVITGASRIEQLQENLKALELVDKFTPESMAEIDQIVGRGA